MDPQQGALIVEAMNSMRYDAMALGSTELDAPLSTVRARFEDAQFGLLSANVKADGALPNVQPYLLTQVDGHTVGIIGVTLESIERRFQALNLDLTVEEPIAAVRQAVDEIRDRADIIILLSNLEQTQARELARAVPDIDVIIGTYKGYQHTPVSVPGVEHEVVLHASYVLGEYLGMLQLYFDAQGRVIEFVGQALPLTEDYEDSPQMVELMQRYAPQQ